MSVKDDFDDDWRPYVQDPDDPSIQVDKRTLLDASSTPEQCVQLVKMLQKKYGRRAGREIFDASIYGLTGWDTWQKLESIVRDNAESEWLTQPACSCSQCAATGLAKRTDRKSAVLDYQNAEYKLKEALKNFDKDKAPVLDALDAMIDWFVEFFVHRRRERWQMERLTDGKDPMEFWRRYFTILKNTAIGFGKDPKTYEGFNTGCNPFCIGV